jgi:hypothetical protein
MDTIRVKVLNPASISLLENLEKLQLISIYKDEKAKTKIHHYIHKKLQENMEDVLKKL